MQRVRMTRAWCGIAIVLAALLSGCQSTPPSAYNFPGTWPGSQPLGEDAPTVSVQPITMNIPQPDLPSEGQGLPTAAVLSALLIKHLQVNGVNAILEQADAPTAKYSLSCTVPTLGYSLQEHPTGRNYEAELTCVLKDEEAQRVVWRRSFSQKYEEQDILDLMTKLPPQPHKHERVLFNECIIPLWDAMASSAGAVVVSREHALQPGESSLQ